MIKKEVKPSIGLDNDILDSLLEGFQMISFDWRYLYVNKSVCQHGKSSKEDLLGFTMMEKYPGIENTEMFKTLKKCMQERVSDKIENEFTYPNNTKGWFELHIEPVSMGLFILSIDITERKRAELKLKQLQKLLEQKVKERTIHLEQANKTINDSIVYARRIQSALLPPEKLIKECLAESLVLYKPKNVVAGDFYWIRTFGQKVLFAVADCTGHGVPGALVSVICNNALNRSVREYGLTDPGLILDMTSELVINEFEKSEEEIMDGMDIALCCLEGRKLEYAGANNPLVIIRNGKLIEIKATKQAIGKVDNPKTYETHSFNLETGDRFYLFTDGYADQFGGSRGKKIMGRTFRKLLLEIQNLSMTEQKVRINSFFEQWQGNMEQVDDVCVMGVEV